MKAIIQQRNVVRNISVEKSVGEEVVVVRALYCTIWNIWISTTHIVSRTPVRANTTGNMFSFHLPVGPCINILFKSDPEIFLDLTCESDCRILCDFDHQLTLVSSSLTFRDLVFHVTGRRSCEVAWGLQIVTTL